MGDWYGKTITPQVKGYKVEQFADAFARVLGVTGVTRVTSVSPSQTDVTAVTVVTPTHGSEGDGPKRAGEPGYLDFVADVHAHGHITRGEALQLELHHQAMLRLAAPAKAA